VFAEDGVATFIIRGTDFSDVETIRPRNDVRVCRKVEPATSWLRENLARSTFTDSFRIVS
jgi:hypothetical protein